MASDRDRDTKHANDVVHLSVGGKEFVTYFGTLANSRSPYFEYMFQVDRLTGRILINYTNIIFDRQDRVFVDRDGELFSHILNYFRDGKRTVLPEDTNTLRRLVREAEFFNLPTLIVILEDRLNMEDKRDEERDIKMETVENTLQKISQQLYASAFRRDYTSSRDAIYTTVLPHTVKQNQSISVYYDVMHSCASRPSWTDLEKADHQLPVVMK